MVSDPLSVETAMIQYDIYKKDDAFLFQVCQDRSKLLLFFLSAANEKIVRQVQMVFQRIIRFRSSCLLNWCKMEGIVAKIHLSKEEIRPFFVVSDTSREYGLFSEFSQFIVLLSEENDIMGSITCGLSCPVRHKGYLKTDDSWNLIG